MASGLRHRFDEQTGPLGAYVIGDPEEVAEKSSDIVRHWGNISFLIPVRQCRP